MQVDFEKIKKLPSDQKEDFMKMYLKHNEMIKVDNIQVVHGDRLWVITDMNEELTSDNFNWTIVIEHLDDTGEVVTTWDSTAGFHGRNVIPAIGHDPTAAGYFPLPDFTAGI